MSAVRIVGIRKTVRQFAVAIAACTAVAGGAALAAATDSVPAAPTTVADGQDNGWPAPPSPAPAPVN